MSLFLDFVKGPQQHVVSISVRQRPMVGRDIWACLVQDDYNISIEAYFCSNLEQYLCSHLECCSARPLSHCAT